MFGEGVIIVSVEYEGSFVSLVSHSNAGSYNLAYTVHFWNTNIKKSELSSSKCYWWQVLDSYLTEIDRGLSFPDKAFIMWLYSNTKGAAQERILFDWLSKEHQESNFKGDKRIMFKHLEMGNFWYSLSWITCFFILLHVSHVSLVC